MQLHCFCFMNKSKYMDKYKHQRGKEIFEEYKRLLHSPDISEDERAYYNDIINVVDWYSYDVSISKDKMFAALEKAERQGKRVKIVPDDDFLEGGARHGQCDGWTYHIEFE